MIPDLAYTNRDLYVFNQVSFRPMCSPSGLSATGLHTRSLCHLINVQTFTESTTKTVAMTKLTSA